MSETEVLILGGGISGLSTAWWLARQGIGVEVWESEPHPGGKIRSSRENGYLTERAAGMLVNFRPEVDLLVQDSGLAGRRCRRPGDLARYVLHQGRLANVPMTLPGMARSPLWSWRGKLRMLCEILIPSGGGEEESVSRFITRRLGREILETAIDPYVSGILASDPDKASARALLPRLTGLEQRYGSIAMGMLVNRLVRRRRANNADIFSFRGGMSDLVSALAGTPGIRMRYGITAQQICREAGQWCVGGESAGGSHQVRVPQLVITVPAPRAAGLLRPVDRELARQLDGIEYAAMAVVHLGLERTAIGHPMDGSGFLVGQRDSLCFNGNLWMSSLFPDRAPAGRSLITSYIGGVTNRDRLGWSDQRIAEDLLAQLTPLLEIHRDLEYLRVDRHQQALPLYHGHYPARVGAIEQRLSRLPGLYLSANYLHGVSIRERIYQGRQTAAGIIRAAGIGGENRSTGRPLQPVHGGC